MRESHVLCGKVSSFPHQHSAMWLHVHVPSKLVQPPMRPHAHRRGHVASHVPPQYSDSVPATAPHSVCNNQKLSSSFQQHVRPSRDKTHTPRWVGPTTESLQSLAPFPRAQWHPPTSSLALPVGCRSLVAFSATCAHIPSIRGEHGACLHTCPCPSAMHHTLYTQKRPAVTPSTSSQQQQ